jgi:hypothetical protein
MSYRDKLERFRYFKNKKAETSLTKSLSVYAARIQPKNEFCADDSFLTDSENGFLSDIDLDLVPDIEYPEKGLGTDASIDKNVHELLTNDLRTEKVVEYLVSEHLSSIKSGIDEYLNEFGYCKFDLAYDPLVVTDIGIKNVLLAPTPELYDIFLEAINGVLEIHFGVQVPSHRLAVLLRPKYIAYKEKHGNSKSRMCEKI